MLYMYRNLTSIAPEDGRVSPKHVELNMHVFLSKCHVTLNTHFYRKII